MSAKRKFDLPTAANEVTCRACGALRALAEFRVFRTATAGGWDGAEAYDAATSAVLMDFCAACEHAHGTLTLYRRFGAYGTAEVAEAVHQAARAPAARRTPEQVRLLVEPKQAKPPETREELVKQELQRRELCRRRLVYYIKTMMPEFLPSWWVQDLCRRLEKFVKDVEEEKSPRLIVAVPPRHGKSRTASDMFPSWVLGKHPDWPIILASYAQELPVEFSRNIRDRLLDPEYKAVFPAAKLRQDAKGVEAWKTTEQGGIKAIGVGGGLTGFGGRILIADDLLRDAEAASSDTIRKNTWDWYQMVFRTRLAPGGGLLMIGTRWHWHDPTGRALELDAELKKAGVPDWERESWEVISYPAIAEHDECLMADGTIAYDVPDEDQVLRRLRNKGDALHPERYPINELKKIRNTLTKSNWSALYQQSPTPDEGDFFRRDDLRYRWLDPAYRPLCRVFMTVDYAIGKKQRNDYTVAGVFALDSNDDMYVLEIRRGRWGTQEIAANVLALVEKHKPELYAGEQGQIHHAVWPIIQAELDKKRLFVSVDDTLVPIQDKEARARPLQGRTQRNKLFFSHDETTRPEIYDITEREMLQFPNGVHDDIVDMMAWGARLALNISLPTTKAPPKPKSWKDKLTISSVGARSHMAA
jgi:predicted phage terminase large subunit-like protein